MIHSPCLRSAESGFACAGILHIESTSDPLETAIDSNRRAWLPHGHSSHERGSQSGTPLLEYDFAYDNLDRMTNVSDTANSAANINAAAAAVPVNLYATYKTNGDLKQSFAKIGSLADYTNVYSYDNLGRLTQVVQGSSRRPSRRTLEPAARTRSLASG